MSIILKKELLILCLFLGTIYTKNYSASHPSDHNRMQLPFVAHDKASNQFITSTKNSLTVGGWRREIAQEKKIEDPRRVVFFIQKSVALFDGIKRSQKMPIIDLSLALNVRNFPVEDDFSIETRSENYFVDNLEVTVNDQILYFDCKSLVIATVFDLKREIAQRYQAGIANVQCTIPGSKDLVDDAIELQKSFEQHPFRAVVQGVEIEARELEVQQKRAYSELAQLRKRRFQRTNTACGCAIQ